MGIRVALCQLSASVGNVGANLSRISETIINKKADVYIFPELFLTGYGADYARLEDDVKYAMDKLSMICAENNVAIAVGLPTYYNSGMRNSMAFIEQNKTVIYDKIHLAKFGVYSENMFLAGNRPRIAEFKGIKFGLSICYDIFVPELYRSDAKMGTHVNICLAASADPSREYLERILPARSLENVMYTVYLNNIGKFGETKFYGHSRLVGPLGNTLSETCGEEDVTCVYIDKDVINNARSIRHHMEDLREDVCWNVYQ